MPFTDTHSHLYLPEFDQDRDEMIKRAIDQKVTKIFLPNIDAESIYPMLQLADKFPQNCFPMIGLHPTSVKKNYQQELNIVEQWLGEKTFFGIGEVGIDLYWDKTFRKEQILAFQHQIQLSLDHKLPLIIHSRNSFQEIFSSLEKFSDKNLRGIFHSFTGTIDEAQKAIRMGFKIGINGIVSFKNSGLDKVVSEIGLDHLVLETDSPYLAPVPKRGKRNESSFLIYIAEKIAEITSRDIKTVAAKTNQNATEVFGN